MLEPKDHKVVLLYKRKAEPDEHVLRLLEKTLCEQGYNPFIDRHLTIGVQWATEIERRIRMADSVIAILSDDALTSEMIQYELETVADERRKTGKPDLLPIRIGSDAPLTGSMSNFVNEFNYLAWRSQEDDEGIAVQVLAALSAAKPVEPKDLPIEPAGGAVSPNSRFYVEREADVELEDALRSNESVILIRGPRQVGKTSLIGRGARMVSDMGWRQVSTDFQMVSSTQLTDADRFCRMLAATLARQLGFKYDFENEWLDVFGPNMNLANFVRAALSESPKPLVWFMDEADRLFTAPFASDFFGLVRSWHNARATDPTGPWGRFTLVIGYASEARLFIRDLNQSPFNVGRQITMKPFTLEQTMDLNERYGSPIKRRSDLEALQFLVAGQPFLTRRALDMVASETMDFHTLIENADKEDGPFGDHLKRILIAVSQVPAVMSALRSSLDAMPLSDSDAIHRLVAAGVLRDLGDDRAVVACDLYAQYLDRHLR
ncbi:MAG TPA: AAA-like domain-containing protein [Fimbriimonas sp.]|nr:AAA-like domain-containing protein [Fimbriimonas sp.]